MSSLLPEPGIRPYVEGRYRPSQLPNGIAYLFSFDALGLPPLGIVAIVLAGRAWRHGRRGARIALLCAVLATGVGVTIWATVVPR
jgi:hypothetical protein